MDEDQEVLRAYLRKVGRCKDDQIEAYLQEHPEEEYKAHLRDAQAWCDGYRRGWRDAQKYLRDAPTAPPQDVPTLKFRMAMEVLSSPPRLPGA